MMTKKQKFLSLTSLMTIAIAPATIWACTDQNPSSNDNLPPSNSRPEAGKPDGPNNNAKPPATNQPLPLGQFGTWNDQTLDFSSSQFWANQSNLDAKVFNLWRDLETNKNKINEKLSYEIHTIDVGQADSLLLKFSPLDPDYFQNELNLGTNWKTSEAYINNTFNILIDAGNFKTENNKDKKTITPNYETKLKNYLNQELAGGDKIDLFVLTHEDADHIGQAQKVMQDFGKPNESVLLNFGDGDKETDTLKKLMAFVAQNGYVYVDPLIDQVFNQDLINQVLNPPANQDPKKVSPFQAFLSNETYGKWETDAQGQKVNFLWNPEKLFKIEPTADLIKFNDYSYFSFLAPTIDYAPNKTNEVNESSINTFLKIASPNKQEFSALFTGDSEGKTHEDVLKVMQSNAKFQKADGSIKVDVHKVAHHGSTTKQSNNANFLAAITDSQTKYLISVNTNKLFSNSPTLKDEFWQNLSQALNHDPANPIAFANQVFVTQNLGDILFSGTANQKTLNIKTTSRNLQAQNQIWNSKSQFTDNPITINDQFANFLYKEK